MVMEEIIQIYDTEEWNTYLLCHSRSWVEQLLWQIVLRIEKLIRFKNYWAVDRLWKYGASCRYSNTSIYVAVGSKKRRR